MPFPRARILVSLVLVVGLWGWTTWWLATWVFQPVPRQVWDFYPLWNAAHTLFLQGGNPYSPATTLRTQQASYGRPARPGEDPRAFSYPLYALLLALPLIGLPQPWAQALWLTGSFGALVAGAGYFLKVATQKKGPLLFLIMLPLLYPLTWALLLGQLSLWVTVILTLMATALLQKRWIWAGFLLAWSTIKPNLTWLLLPSLLRWAWRTPARSLIPAWALTQTALLLWAEGMQPNWLLDFWQALQRYAQQRPFVPPLVLALQPWLPPLWQTPAYLMLAALLLAGWVWYLHRTQPSWLPLMVQAQALTFLITPRAHIADQAILTPWVLLLLARTLWPPYRRGRLLVGLFLLGYSLATWWIHAALLSPLPPVVLERAQHRWLTLWLPLLLLIISPYIDHGPDTINLPASSWDCSKNSASCEEERENHDA